MTAAGLKRFLSTMPALLRRRRIVLRSLAHLENRIETYNLAGEFEAGMNLLGAIETMRLRLAKVSQDIEIELEELFR